MKLLKLLIFVFSFSNSVFALLPTEIKVCDDGDEWPPYAFYERTKGVKSNKIIGYSVDFFDEILKKNKLKATYSLIPWSRCLEGVKKGEYDMALNATVNPERLEQFLPTEAYYILSESYIYKTGNNLAKVQSTKDFKKKIICGQKGYNYTYLEIEDTDIKYSMNSFPAAIEMIKSNRCDLMPVNTEVVLGYKIIGVGNYLNDPALKIEKIPGVSGTEYVMLVSKSRPYSNELLKLINSGIADLKNSKIEKELKHNYFQD
jgi:polar amino acid transport system substrate-binding protein